MKRDYKIRLLDEYRDLIRKRVKLELFLDNDVEGKIPIQDEWIKDIADLVEKVGE